MERRLNQYGFQAATLRLSGGYRVLYERFVQRNQSSERHFGHVANLAYPPEGEADAEIKTMTYEEYVNMVQSRGMDRFFIGEFCIDIDTTDFSKVDSGRIIERLRAFLYGGKIN